MATVSKITIRHEVTRSHSYQSAKHAIEIEILPEEGEETESVISQWQGYVSSLVENEVIRALDSAMADHTERNRQSGGRG